MPKIEIEGAVSWNGKERRMDRYGGISLFQKVANVNEGESSPPVDFNPVFPLIGKRIKLSATVLESNVSCHIGDMFRGISPSQTPVGETVELGTGLFVEYEGDADCPQIIFRRDERDKDDDDWMDPRDLYRLHDHVVRLTLETVEAETSANPSIWGEDISRPIGKADVEFYESGLVLRMALILSGASDSEWAAYAPATRTKWIDRGIDAVHRLLKDKDVVQRLPNLTKNLTERL
jgi:hypothetical protein